MDSIQQNANTHSDSQYDRLGSKAPCWRQEPEPSKDGRENSSEAADNLQDEGGRAATREEINRLLRQVRDIHVPSRRCGGREERRKDSIVSTEV